MNWPTDSDAGFVPVTQNPEPSVPAQGPVKTWSPTLWDTFRKCKHAVFLRRVAKIKLDEKNEFAERGIKAHDKAERFVRGELKKIPKELNKFRSSMDMLREQYRAGMLHMEEDWIFNQHWEPVEKFAQDAWAWMKLDVFAFDDAEKAGALIVDYKTGKKMGNEAKHSLQLLDYSVAAFMKYPNLRYVRAEIWYLDTGEKLKKSYTRDLCLGIFLDRVTARGMAITTETSFPPSASGHNCRYCTYKEKCEWAVLDEPPYRTRK